MELVAVESGVHEITIAAARPRGRDQAAGRRRRDDAQDAAAARGVASGWYKLHDPEHCSLLWPAEKGFSSDSPFEVAAIAYPMRDQGWLPSGEVGILITFVLASMLFGFIALKPLGVQI